MKAVRINQWGQPVRIEDIPRPTPSRDEVLVRVHAASLNPVDGAIAAGYMASMYSTPMTLGTDFAGEVLEAGQNVGHLIPGDAVYGISLNRGTFAEAVVVPANGVARKPNNLDDLHAAAVPLAGLTAWQTLFNLAKVQSGERVLIHGAGVNVGSFAVQLARGVGVTVIAHDKADKEAYVRGLGAQEFISADRQRFEDLAGAVDVILDYVGGELVERSLNMIKPGGRYVTSAGTPAPEAGASRGVQVMSTFTRPTIAELDALAEQIDAGRLKVTVQRAFPLDQAAAALAFDAQTSAPGKVVIQVP